jgi:hypothetical protein
MRGFTAGLLLIIAVACSQKLTPVDTSTPVPTDDGDADADADADADTDADADVDTGPQLDCTQPYDTPVPGSDPGFPECVTERVFCGQVIFGTTTGGTTDYDYQWWLDAADLGALIGEPERVDGPERVYAFEPLFTDSQVTFTVESCDEVWASWISMGDLTDYCAESTQAPKDHFDEVQGRFLQEADVVNFTANTNKVQVIVDSSASTPTNYLMTVTCD